MSGFSSVVVVGGGASGTLAAVHLLREARARAMPLEVVLIDQYGRHALGQAYSTTDPHHLLNACANKMSGLDDDPGHFLRWALDDGLDVSAADYLPRRTYGRYLRDLLAGAEEWPLRVVRKVTGTVTALTRGRGRGVRVHLSGGGRVDAEAAVLALGNRSQSARLPVVDAASPGYVADPWAPDALAGIRDGAPVLVLGTGLTMVDVAVTVTRAHPGTVVHAVSRHALLPRTHPRPVPPPVPTAIPDGPLGVGDLLRAVRLAVRDNGGDWYGVVDGLRPRAQELWTRLPADDQRRFLRLAARYWEVHRHRIPPVTAARIADLRATGRLRVLRGRLLRAAPGPAGLRVQVGTDSADSADSTGGLVGADGNGGNGGNGGTDSTGGAVRELDVGWLVNATGPGADITRDPLLAGLVADGVVRPDRLRLGLDAAPGGAVLDAEGAPDDRIFTLGPLLRGSLYETTAIPEIRAQAAALAPRLVRALAPGTRLPLPRPSSERDQHV
ncbi:FAD/NAD(P)-binding protein [Streptosporangium sp. NPDC002721]|uniref:FAD/NAD(P)-binding protein n=1 Tax=Streptosporangium sp. NPDC002721 TaxID=3366188 RepID=UPI0036B2891C